MAWAAATLGSLQYDLGWVYSDFACNTRAERNPTWVLFDDALADYNSLTQQGIDLHQQTLEATIVLW